MSSGHAPMDLAGHLLVRPAGPLPTIASTRPRHLPRVLRGRSVAQALALLPACFTLCAAAHRLTARLATRAALGQADPAGATVQELDLLQRETLGEHLRRLWLDLPLQLGAAPASDQEMKRLADWLQALRGPPGAPGAPGSPQEPAVPAVPEVGLGATVLHAVFGRARPEALAQALGQGQDGPIDAWLDDAQAIPGAAAARAIAPWHGRWRQLATARDAPLPQTPEADFLAHCDRHLDADDDFESAPTLPDGPAETGPWTRQGLPAPRHALDRVLGRFVELARLAEALPSARRPAARVLAAGSWSPAPGRGLGWTQMARGLLVHRATLSGTGAQARVDDYRVLAPTEWNFHPRGAAARALSALHAGDALDADVARIAAAFDPCVSHRRVDALPGPGGRDA